MIKLQKKSMEWDWAFIVRGINTGRLEYREGSIYGNPYLRVLRGQLEEYIVEELGEESLNKSKNQTELRKIKKEIATLKSRLKALNIKKAELEA